MDLKRTYTVYTNLYGLKVGIYPHSKADYDQASGVKIELPVAKYHGF